MVLTAFTTTNSENPSVNYQVKSLSGFVANNSEGWTAHSSYLNILEDSIQFELILFRDVPSGANWESNSWVGTLSENYRPNEQRVFDYSELPRIWKITIETDGRCFFKLQSGPIPEGQPVVLPLITKYKK